jgi:diguanylate cyclase (GGDEF)-like protein/PAS domain S-box-containing protein
MLTPDPLFSLLYAEPNLNRSILLLRTCYAVSRVLIRERDMSALLQGLCDQFVGAGVYRAALLVLLDRTSDGMVTAEAGFGDRTAPIMATLREGKLPPCGARVLDGDPANVFVCTGEDCSLCTPTGLTAFSGAFCASFRCNSKLSGFLLLVLPSGGNPAADESATVAELAGAIAHALRQLFLFEEFTFRERELKEAEERYELALRASQAGLWDWNIKTSEMYTSPDQWELLDYRAGDAAAGKTRRFMHPEDRERVLAVLNQHLTGVTEEYRIEYRVMEPEGKISWFLDRGRVVERDENNMPVRMTGTHQNITLHKRQEQALAAVQQQLHEARDVERNFLQTVIDSAGDPVMVIDPGYTLLLINRAAARLVSGNGEIDSLVGRKCHQLFCGVDTPCDDPDFPCPVRAVAELLRPTKVLHHSFHGNGIHNTFELEVSPLKDSEGKLYGIIEVARDVTDRLRIEQELRDSQSRLYRLAHHDTLTGLPNRLLFRDRLTQALNKAERNRTKLAVLFLDLDKFKTVNDTLGHDVGDDLLVEIAARLQRQCRQSDTVARLGGDEFVFVLEAVNSREDAAVVAEKIMAALAAPVCVSGHELPIAASVGIALYPEDSLELEGMIKCADIALYAAKESGRCTFQFYRRDMAPQGRQPQLDERQFSAVLASDGLCLDYLPQFAVADGRVAGLKACFSWNHPEMGLLQPGDFLPAADECGMLAGVSQWLLDQVGRDLRAWRGQGLDCVPVTVPLASCQLLHPECFHEFERILADTALPAESLVVEVKERPLAHAAGWTQELLKRLRGLGLQLAVDGCGIEHCPLPSLRQLRIGRITVQADLLAALADEDGNGDLAAAVIALGHAVGLTVLADGIRHERQLAFLRAKGCDLFQGPLRSPPLTARQIADLLRFSAKGG